MSRRRRCLLGIATLALLSPAAGAGAAPQRIVSLLPSLTESVCALGACARLVGVDRYSNWPESVKALPTLGGLDDPAIERIVGLQPDLVLAAPSSRATDRLRALGLRVELIRAETHDDVRRALRELERLLEAPGTAEPLWQRLQREIDAAAARVPVSLHGQRVYFEVDSSGYAAGEASFIGQTLKRLGLANAVPAALGPFPRLNPEWVVRHPPDVLMAVDRELAAMPRRPGWSTLDALQRRRVCAFPHARYELLIRPGPRLGEAAALLADCLQGLPAAGPAPSTPTR
jgi:iron complex transport system substrate-binding protein